MAQIHLYAGATAGATDGTEISSNRTFLNAIETTINAGESETKIIPIAIRCDSVYAGTDVTITTDVFNETANAWSGNTDTMVAFSLAETGLNATDVLEIGNVSDVNKIFYVVISSSNLQAPSINKNTGIKVNYTVESVS